MNLGISIPMRIIQQNNRNTLIKLFFHNFNGNNCVFNIVWTAHTIKMQNNLCTTEYTVNTSLQTLAEEWAGHALIGLAFSHKS